MFKKLTIRAVLGLVLVGFITIIVWALLVTFLPNGWWITVINILGFLISIIVIGVGEFQALKIVIPSVWAFVVGMIIWAIMAIVVRSFILQLLGVI